MPFIELRGIRLYCEIRGAPLALFDGGHYFMLQDPAVFQHMTEFLVA